MNLKKMRFGAIALCVVAALQVAVVSCSDDPGVENYYTQSREYASSYLQNRSQFSEYLKILEKARGEYNLHLVDMLGTYGDYTVFAPTNEAVEKYLAERGLSSVDELSVADCDTIPAHLFPAGWRRPHAAPCVAPPYSPQGQYRPVRPVPRRRSRQSPRWSAAASRVRTPGARHNSRRGAPVPR